MRKDRRLFCELSPFCYQISVRKEALKKDARDLVRGTRIAKKRQSQSLPCIWKSDAKLIKRRLEGVDMQLQINKATNLRLAAEKLDGLVVLPGETFSFWNTVGQATAAKGYLEGLVIHRTELKSGVGGGLCQMANLIHYLVLHSPLEVTELHHHSDALFPDFKRRVPFGTGTSICYKSLDYRFKNTSAHPVQLRIWVQDGEMLMGELRSSVPLSQKYRLVEENHHYAQDDDGVFYRNSLVYRLVTDRESGALVRKELVLRNHSRVLYDPSLIPLEEIRTP